MSIVWSLNGLWSQTYPFTTIGLKDGLPQSSVFKVLQDRQGYIWMATEAGLTRYNGYEFKTYSYHTNLDANYINDIELDANGNLWVASYGTGIAVFDGKSFTSYNRSQGLKSIYLKDICFASNGDLWIASYDAGLIRISADYPISVRYYTEIGTEYTARKVCEATDGDIYAATSNGLYRIPKSHQFNKVDKLIDGSHSAVYVNIYNDVWYGSESTLGFIRNDSIFDRSNVIHKDQFVQEIVQLPNDSTLYICTNEGLVMLKGDKVNKLTTENGLSYDLIKGVFKDSFGNLWVPTYGNGVTIMNDKGIQHFTKGKNGKELCVYTIIEDKSGVIWFGDYEGGFYTWNDSVLQPSSIGFMENDDPRHVCIDKEGNLYFMVNKSRIYKVSDNRIVWKWDDPTGYTEMYGVTIFDEEHLLLSTVLGAYLLNINSHELTHIKETGNTFYIDAFWDSFGRIWLLGDGGSVYIYENGIWKDISLHVNPEGIGINMGLHDAKHNRYYFATDKGLLVWNEQSRYIFHSGNILQSDVLFSLTQDQPGRIWVGHSEGVECLDEDRMTIKYYGYDQGFTPIETNAGAAYTDSKGNVWIGALTSATKIDVNKLEADSTTGRLRVERIYVNEEIMYEENYYDTAYPDLTLKHDQNNIELDLVSLCYSGGHNVVYSWKLEGWDKGWNSRKNQRQIIYSNVSPGEYTFRAKATNPNGYVTNEIVLKFVIRKPFWNTPGFYIFEIIVFLFIVYLSFRFTRQSSTNRLGQIMTLLTIFILFESIMLYISSYTDKFTNGIPVFQLVMNVLLASTLHPIEQRIQRQMKKWARRKK